MEASEPRTIHYTELGPTEPGSKIAQEWDTYRREVGRLLAEGHEGKHVLIKGDEILGLFDTREAATKEGYKRFLVPPQPFLVHQIQTRERVYRVSQRWRPRTCPTAP